MNSIFLWYFLSPAGRINRQEFRLGYLGLLAINVVLTKVVDAVVFDGKSGPGYTWDKAELQSAMLFPLLFSSIILFWPFVAIFVKRLHDVNLSGWWWFATLAIPFVTPMIGMSAPTVFIILLVVLGALPGSDGPNSFGAAPRPRPSQRRPR